MCVKQRLITFITSRDLTISQFEKRVGVAKGYVNNISKSIGLERLERISHQFPELNKGWLLTGEGSMLKDSHLADSQNSFGQPPARNGDTEPPFRDVRMVNLLPISAQAGRLNDFVAQVREADCEKIVSPIKGADLAISVMGDSMSPEYPNGSKVFIKRINERAFIEWGATFVLDTCNGIIMKQIFPVEGDESKIRCHSINPRFPDFELRVEDVFGFYRVLLCMALK